MIVSLNCRPPQASFPAAALHFKVIGAEGAAVQEVGAPRLYGEQLPAPVAVICTRLVFKLLLPIHAVSSPVRKETDPSARPHMV